MPPLWHNTSFHQTSILFESLLRARAVAISYFSVHFQPKVFLILFLIFVFVFPEQNSVKKTDIDGVELILLQ